MTSLFGDERSVGKSLAGALKLPLTAMVVTRGQANLRLQQGWLASAGRKQKAAWCWQACRQAGMSLDIAGVASVAQTSWTVQHQLLLYLFSLLSACTCSLLCMPVYEEQ